MPLRQHCCHLLHVIAAYCAPAVYRRAMLLYCRALWLPLRYADAIADTLLLR